jgi:hypothetical protein
MSARPTISQCVDLRPLARARRWRWRFEESYQAERDLATRGDGRWYVEVLCRRGMIYPAGGDQLIAYTDTRGVLRKLLALDPALRVHQHGDAEASVRFPVALLDAVAGVLRPRRRRTLTPERARAIGSATTYGAQVRSGGPEAPIAQPDGLAAVPAGDHSPEAGGKPMDARRPMDGATHEWPDPMQRLTPWKAATHRSADPMVGGDLMEGATPCTPRTQKDRQ